jgi:hypothetical protein
MSDRFTQADAERFQNIAKHYESILKEAAELLDPGGCGRGATLVVHQDLPKVLADLARLREIERAARAFIESVDERADEPSVWVVRTGACEDVLRAALNSPRGEETK